MISSYQEETAMQNFFTSQLDENTCSIMGYSGDEERVVIPAILGGKKVTILFDGLFKNHPEIRFLKIPATVTNIGSYLIQKICEGAFEGCEKLKEVVYGPEVEISPKAYDSGVPDFSVHEKAVHTRGYNDFVKREK